MVFFDDFASIAERLSIDSVLVTFSDFPLLGANLKETKSEAWPDFTFLVL